MRGKRTSKNSGAGKSWTGESCILALNMQSMHEDIHMSLRRRFVILLYFDR